MGSRNCWEEQKLTNGANLMMRPVAVAVKVCKIKSRHPLGTVSAK